MADPSQSRGHNAAGRASDAGRPAAGPARPERIERGGARGVRREEAGAQASDVSAARTRTMGAVGQDAPVFSARDYQAPAGVGEPGAQTRASAADVAGLGRAEGVSSLREGHLSRSQQERSRAGEVERRRVLPVAIAMAVVVVAIGVGSFFLFRGVITSINEGASSESAATYATDAYVLMAQVADDGSLEGAWLAYVDSINGRTELCHLASNVAATMPSGQDAGTLADVYASAGLEQLVTVVKAMADIDVAASFEVTDEQMGAIIDTATGDQAALSVDELVRQIGAREGQDVTSPALRGLLVTMRDVGSEGFVQMEAPADGASDESGAQVLELRADEWQTMVRGMRDAAGDVTLAW